jgi:hypothetical protein
VVLVYIGQFLGQDLMHVPADVRSFGREPPAISPLLQKQPCGKTGDRPKQKTCASDDAAKMMEIRIAGKPADEEDAS